MKNPENMTADERLKRIRSLERKVRELENRVDWAEREQKITHAWALEQCAEVRRLHGVCEQHWAAMNEARRVAGLDSIPATVPLARFDHEARQWVPWPFSPDEESIAGRPPEGAQE